MPDPDPIQQVQPGETFESRYRRLVNLNPLHSPALHQRLDQYQRLAPVFQESSNDIAHIAIMSDTLLLRQYHQSSQAVVQKVADYDKTQLKSIIKMLWKSPGPFPPTVDSCTTFVKESQDIRAAELREKFFDGKGESKTNLLSALSTLFKNKKDTMTTLVFIAFK
jgi:hypothetical protein